MSNYTINSLVKLLTNEQLILPSIQRKFVWEEERICQLFDSIMRRYPIGQLLLWKINAETIKDIGIPFYKFMQDESENQHLNFVSKDKEYYAVLDGQQRIQALIKGLIGSITVTRYKKEQQKRLYLNLLGKPNEEEEYEYQFEFLTKQQLQDKKDGAWYLIKNILEVSDSKDISKQLNEFKFDTEDDKNMARDLLNDLANYINKDKEIIKCYEIPESFKLDDVLEIFVRTNSGGITLSKTDLLFSTLVSKWHEGRETIDSFIKEINNKGNSGKKYKFTVDFIMRTTLYLLDKKIEMKVENFKESVENIQEQWPNIANAIRKTVVLLGEFGFSDDNITAYNAIMPIIYYVYNDGMLKDNDKKELKKYFIIAQLKRLFGVASNSALNETRKCLKGERSFDLKLFKDITLVGERNFKITEEIIDTWLEKYEKGEVYTFMILTLLYPNLKVGSVEFHQDHLHPESKLRNMPDFKSRKDKLANLQLLEGKENTVHKRDMDLKDWVSLGNTVQYLPEKYNLDIENYDNFLKDRGKLMKKELLKILS